MPNRFDSDHETDNRQQLASADRKAAGDLGAVESVQQSPELLELKRDGEQALARFFAESRDRLKKIVQFRLDYRLKGRVSESDIIQDTYVRAAKRLDGFLEKPDMPFFVWLRLEIQQRLAEIHRFHFNAEKRDVRKEVALPKPQQVPGQTSLAIAAHLVAQLTSPSQVYHRAEQIAQLETALNTMNEVDREVIALRHFEELSNIETAQVLGIEAPAASKRYFRALKRLREIMESVK